MAYNLHITWVVAGWLRTYWPFGTPSLTGVKHYNRQILLLYRTITSDYFIILNWRPCMSVSWTIIHNNTFSCMEQFFLGLLPAAFEAPHRKCTNALVTVLHHMGFQARQRWVVSVFSQDDCLITDDVNEHRTATFCRSHWLPSVDRGRSGIKQMLGSWWR